MLTCAVGYPIKILFLIVRNYKVHWIDEMLYTNFPSVQDMSYIKHQVYKKNADLDLDLEY